MKRQLALRRGRLELNWEIERDGVSVTTRSSGRNRKPIVRTKRLASPAAAKREVEEQVELQRGRGFVEQGARAAAVPAKMLPKGRQAVADAKQAIVTVAIPVLRDLGFEGSFPNFRRVDDDRHSVVVFAWGRAQGMVNVQLGVVGPLKGATPAQDAKRVFGVRNRQRASLDDLTREADWKLFSFDNAAEKWREEWPAGLASLLAKLIKTKGLAWLEAPERRPKTTRRARSL